MIQRLLFYIGKTPEWLVWAFFTGAMTVSANVALQETYWLGALYIPHFIFLAALSNSERLTGVFAVRKGMIAIVCCAIGAVLCIALVGFQGGLKTPVGVSGFHRIITSYVIIGAIVGALLRNATSRLLDMTLLGKKRLGQNILFTALWTVGILAFPWEEAHKEAGPWYVAGIAVGVLISRSFRAKVTKAMATFRRIHEVFDAWPRGAQTSSEELEALKLLAKGRQFPFFRFTKLRNKLEDWRGTGAFTNRMALISAALYRIEGEYLGAIAEADLAQRPLENLEDVHLMLLKALSLIELEGEDKGDSILKEILETEIGQECPLATATVALRAAEGIFKDVDHIQVSDEPLKMIRRALDLRRQILSSRNGDSEEVLNRFVVRYTEIGIPLTAPFMMDILGYCFMAAGYPDEGRIFLEKCIELDRSYGRAYLHLGDYFMSRSQLRGLRLQREREKKHENWHARACYYAARSSQRSRTSHVRRQALLRLQELSDLL